MRMHDELIFDYNRDYERTTSLSTMPLFNSRIFSVLNNVYLDIVNDLTSTIHGSVILEVDSINRVRLQTHQTVCV